MTIEIALVVSTAVQALATIVLVGVTIFYAVQTKKTVDAMDRNSKAEFLPILMLGIMPTECNERTLKINLQNVGKGLAKREVKVIFPGMASIYLNSILPSGDMERVTLTYDLGYILQIPDADRKIIIEYHDIFGRKIKTEANLVEKNHEINNIVTRYAGWDSWQPLIP